MIWQKLSYLKSITAYRVSHSPWQMCIHSNSESNPTIQYIRRETRRSCAGIKACSPTFRRPLQPHKHRKKYALQLPAPLQIRLGHHIRPWQALCCVLFEPVVPCHSVAIVCGSCNNHVKVPGINCASSHHHSGAVAEPSLRLYRQSVLKCQYRRCLLTRALISLRSIVALLSGMGLVPVAPSPLFWPKSS